MRYYVHTMDINSHVSLVASSFDKAELASLVVPAGLDTRERERLASRAMNLLGKLEFATQQESLPGGFIATLVPIKCHCDKCEVIL